MNQSMAGVFSMRNSLLICSAISITILLLFNGTGKEADSIEHYLFAKYAIEHPKLFLDHWAKPIFTLLAAPFAQFGFIGVKLFNVLCSLFSAYFIVKIAHALDLKYSGLAAIFYFIFPLSFLTTYSGLTEPLFALFLSWSLFLVLKKKYLFAASLISFCPFIRSEGLVIIGVFALFFMLNRNWKAIALLCLGHLTMGIVGSFIYGNILWVFTKIPYASLSSGYGKGSLLHFVIQFHKIPGLPLSILFWIGFISIWYKTIKSRDYKSPIFIIVFIGFIAFFIAHSLFWYFGIFHSMGLKRVFAAITPFIAILSLMGFNHFSLFNTKYKNNLILLSLLAIIFIFPFTSNHAAVEWEKLNLSNAQLTAKKVTSYIKSKDLDQHRFIYADPYLGELMSIDPYDKARRQILSPLILKKLKKGDLIIWDNWHSVVDFKVGVNDLLKVRGLRKLKEVQKEDSQYFIFLKD